MTRRAAAFSITALSLLLLVPSLVPAGAIGGQAGVRLSGVVTHVVDGDTLVVSTGSNGPVTVRLEGIDAPEGGQVFGDEARRQLRVLAFSQRTALLVKETDVFGRLVARVIVGSRDASEEMVRGGFAWHFTNYSSDKVLARLEAQARQQRIGLWADGSPVPPWTWRDQKARGRAKPPPRAAPAPDTAAVQGPFHGNASSRIYHAPGCRDYNCKNCTMVFATREQAESAGYRAHRACVPYRFGPRPTADPGSAMSATTG
ncbi:MAG TPA: thermonuclease family protein [Vicinamibacterales bacterium]|nr:thermonuclease family protein [Vicinamibacterales bacterium]